MTPWWSEHAAAWIGGGAGGGLGMIAGLYGAMCGMLAPRGLCRTLVLSIHVTVLALGVVSLIVGASALLAGQPYHVWYPLGLIGMVMAFVMGGLLPVVLIRYRQAEARKLAAAEIRHA